MLVSRLTHADAARLVVRRRLPALCLPLLVCTFGPILSASSARRRARVGALVLPQSNVVTREGSNFNRATHPRG